MHLPHGLPAVDLHRHLAQVELGRDLLVRAPDDYERHDLALAIGQRRVALAQFGDEHRLLAPFPITLDRSVYGVEQFLVVEWLGEELDGARLHRPYAHRDVAVTGDEDD